MIGIEYLPIPNSLSCDIFGQKKNKNKTRESVILYILINENNLSKINNTFYDNRETVIAEWNSRKYNNKKKKNDWNLPVYRLEN